MKKQTSLNLSKVLLTIVLMFFVLFLVSEAYVVYGESEKPIPQSRAMLNQSKHLESALAPGPWPPGYPLLLLGARKIHIPIGKINLLLFYSTLFLIFLLSKKALPAISPIWLPLLYSICAFNYYNLSQFTSEALVVPLSILALLLLAAYIHQRSFLTILALSFCCSLLFISRYHALLWLMPVIALNLFTVVAAERNVQPLHWISFVTIALGPLSIVLLRNYQATGYLTGMDRTDWASRTLQTGGEYFATSTGFQDNLSLTLKTYFFDFLSPFEYATHGANRRPYSVSGLEIIGIVLFLLIIVVVVAKIICSIKNHGSIMSAFRAWYNKSPLTILAAEFFFGYILVTILVWTLGNNDPIYSRFLYPSYLYLIVLLLFGYTNTKIKGTINASKYLFLGFFLYFIAINLYKMIFLALQMK